MKTQKKFGFTIIEVVLVLAIAGLIFLMVFVALPTLQRNQRDTQRRNDMALVASAMTQYRANNGGDSSSPNTTPNGVYYENGGKCSSPISKRAVCSFVQNYLISNGVEKDPDGAYYKVYFVPNWAKISETTFDRIISADGWRIPDNNDAKIKPEDGSTASNISATISGDDPFNAHIIWVIPGAKCDGSYAKTADPNNVAVLYQLEGSGVYCAGD